MSNPYQPPSAQDPSGQEPYPTYGQQPDPYGQQRGPGGYPGAAAQPYHDGYVAPTGSHPQGTLVLVLGIAGLLVAGILSPVAWVLGSRALKEIRATGLHPANEQLLVVGRVLGIIGTLLLVLAVVLGVILVVLTAVAAVSLQ